MLVEPRKSLKSRIYRWGPVALWMMLIFFLSAQSELPNIPGLGKIDYSDKIKHVIFYAVLACLVWRALNRKSPKWWQIGVTIAIVIAYGLLDESHQLYVPGRTFDLLDLSADTLGAAIAAVALTIWMGDDVDGGRNAGLRS